MMNLLDVFSRKAQTEGVAPRGLEKTVLQHATAATGFPFGAVVDQATLQATIAVGVEQEDIVPDTTWRKFESSVVHMDGLVATVTVDETCRGKQRSRAGVTIKAEGREQRRDVTEMMTDLARRANTLHTAAAVSGIDATLLTADELLAITTLAWDPADTASTPQWPALGVNPVTETPMLLAVGDRRSISWEIDLSDPEVADEVAEAINVIQFGPTVLRWARIFRPVTVADADDSTAATGEGRRSGVLTAVVDGSDPDHLEVVAAQVLSVLSARTRLRVRRAVGRQQVMAAAGLGIGVLGWQHIEVTR